MVLEYLVSLHQFHLKFIGILPQSVTIGFIKMNGMITISGDLNATLVFRFTKALSDLGFIGFKEVFTIVFCCPCKLFLTKLIWKSLLLGAQATSHKCISSNDTERFIKCIPILPLNTNVVW